MLKQILLVTGLAVSVSAMADGRLAQTGKVSSPELLSVMPVGQLPEIEAHRNDGSRQVLPKKAAQARPQWKRPAGQFWGTGYSIDEQVLGYLYAPLVLRPFTDYKFENISNVSGVPAWEIEYADFEQQKYVFAETDEQDVTWSWSWGESPYAPSLSYPGFVGYPAQYEGKQLSQIEKLFILADKDIASGWELGGQPVCSHYWANSTRNPTTGGALAAYTGAKDYEGKETGRWFGTNAMGINAAATRFEKPDQPYLLNAVYWYYQYSKDITKEVPLTAFVFKTADAAVDKSYENSEGQIVHQEGVEFSELIAVAQGVIPVQKFSRDAFQGAVKFEFMERNPVTGAETAVSLEIEDDITIVVVGFDVQLENGGFVTSALCLDDYDEGYGNLGFLGSLEMDEAGNIGYDLVAIKDFFRDGMPNSTVGVLADVSYPWLVPNLIDQPDDILLPNEDSQQEDVQGLQYILSLLSSSMTEDWDVTFNGEEECDWLQIADVYDQTYEGEDGEPVYNGMSMLLFQAEPNPDDVDRTCVVNISIPAASYEITFRQGTNNNAVEIVGADANAVYYDLQGRRVANPDKGIYIRKTGNKTSKVIL